MKLVAYLGGYAPLCRVRSAYPKGWGVSIQTYYVYNHSWYDIYRATVPAVRNFFANSDALTN